MKSNKCATCDQEFPSRNKLFQHLKDSGHGVTGEDKKDDATTGVDAKADGSIKTEDGMSASKGNEAFYEYYLRQNICGTGKCGEKKWKDAYKLLCTPLPISYRIQESSWMGSDFCADFLDAIENNLFDKNCEGGENNGHGMDETNVTNNNNDDNEKKNIYHWSLASDDIPVQTNTTPSDTKPCSSNPLPKIRMAIIPHHHNRENNNGQSKRNASSKDDKNNTYLSIIHALQELGAIHRQELVSAIPPLVLWSASSLSNKEKEGEHKEGGGGVIIADMCAAPGSKSLQLLDLLHMGPKNVNDADAGAVAKDTLQIPAGLLVVNDSDRNRIMTLCQRLRRVPKAPMLAINVDARYFPGMRRKCKWNGGGGVSKREVLNSVDIASNQNNETTKANSKEKMTKAEDDSFCNSHKKPFFMEKMGYKQKYDKVLCDVPCSGDGTTRKNNQVWNAWSISHAMSLHRLQRKILRRAMEMLKPGGILVYSTCSLNPLENEAVIASVIGDIGGSDGGGVEAIEIVPLPEWVERKCRVLDGLSNWKVPSPNFEKGKTSKKSGSDEGSNGISKRVMYSHFDDVPVEDRGDGKGKGGSINSSMFPPLKDLEIVQQLSRCGRFLPSGDLDSGGFFVACLRRLRVGELEGKAKAHNVGLGSTTTNGAKSKMALDEALGNAGAEVNSASAESSKVEGPKTGILSTDERCLREGDWICPKCNEMNFGRRGDSRCFKCKARNIKVAKSLERKRRENDDNPQPLLIQVPNPCVPSSENSETNHILTSFLHTFGISVDAKDKTSLENPFPLGNIRIMRRTNTQTLVLVSDSLANLAISSKWAPVRELGISLASFPSQPPSESDKHTTTGFNLFDEGLPLIAKYATRRHLKLNPIAFRKALAQSVCNPPDSASAEETKRIKGTVGKSVIEFDDICEGTIWYESIQGSSLTSAWEQCKAIPGYFIVSCDCAMQSNTNRIGYFSFSGRVDSHGNVYVETSLRIIAAMLVVVHYYIETNLTDYEHELGTKRRKIDAERK